MLKKLFLAAGLLSFFLIKKIIWVSACGSNCPGERAAAHHRRREAICRANQERAFCHHPHHDPLRQEQGMATAADSGSCASPGYRN